MQLLFEMNFILKVIMEEWIISVNTAMPYTLRTNALLIDMMNLSNAVTMDLFNFLSFSHIQMKSRSFYRELMLNQEISGKTLEVTIVLWHFHLWGLRSICHKGLGPTDFGFMAKSITELTHFILNLVKQPNLDNFTSYTHP
jgi:hypothetical protein